MADGYDPHRQALDVILVPDSDDAIGTHSVRFIQGFTRATCLVAILTCAIEVLDAEPGLAHNVDAAVSILESCVNVMCNFRAVGHEDEYYEMLRLPVMFASGVGGISCGVEFCGPLL